MGAASARTMKEVIPIDKEQDLKMLRLLAVPNPDPLAAGLVFYQAPRGEDLGFDEGEVLSLAAGLREFAGHLEDEKASKPVRRGSPTLGRFDSGAAPLPAVQDG
jgi:hypothetical protein